MVIAPRPNDYHPDHRYTGVLVQDAAYMVVVPNIVPRHAAAAQEPRVPVLRRTTSRRPNPFRPDIAVDIDGTWAKKVSALDAHVSQFYEWLPWVDGKLDPVPKDPASAQAVAREVAAGPITPAVRAALVKWYGAERGDAGEARRSLRGLRVRQAAQ